MFKLTNHSSILVTNAVVTQQRSLTFEKWLWECKTKIIISPPADFNNNFEQLIQSVLSGMYNLKLSQMKNDQQIAVRKSPGAKQNSTQSAQKSTGKKNERCGFFSIFCIWTLF